MKNYRFVIFAFCLKFIFFFALNAIAFQQSGKITLNNGEVLTFTSIDFQNINDHEIYVKFKNIDKIKKIILLEPGKAYDGTKKGTGKLKVIRRDGKPIMFGKAQILGYGQGGRYIKIITVNPVTKAVEERSINNNKINVIEFE